MQLKTRHWDRRGNGGLTFTELGFGTAPIANLYRTVSEEDARAALEAAWDAGVRYFDTAPFYGGGTSERRMGKSFSLPGRLSMATGSLGIAARIDLTRSSRFRIRVPSEG